MLPGDDPGAAARARPAPRTYTITQPSGRRHGDQQRHGQRHPADGRHRVTPTDTATIRRPQTPALTIDKTPAHRAATAGSTIAYSFLVTNTGNVTLTGIAVNDANLDAAACAR